MSLGGGGSVGAAGAIRAGRAFVEMYLNDNLFLRGLERLGAGFSSVGKHVAGLGAGIAGIGSTAFAPLTALFKGALDEGSSLTLLAGRLGTNVETVSRFSSVAKAAGLEMEDFAHLAVKMQRGISEAADGTGPAADEFRKLGLNARELLTLPLDQQFRAMAEAVAAVPNPADRARAAIELFGKSGADLLPVLAKGGAGFDELVAKAEKFGLGMSNEQAAQAKQAKKAIGEVKLAYSKFIDSFGEALLPLAPQIAEIAGEFVNAFIAARKFVEDNKEIVQQVFLVSAAVVAAGTAITTLGGAIIGVGVGIGGIVAAFAALKGAVFAVGAFLVSPLGLALIAVTALTVAFFTLTDAGKRVGDNIRGYLTESLGTFSTAWGGIRDAMAAGDLELAAKVAFAGLNVEFQRMTVELQKGWNEFKESFVDGWHDVVAGMEVGFNNLVDSVAKGMVSTTEEINKASRALADFLAFDELADASVRWGGFWDDFLKDATGALAKIEKMLKLIISKISLVTEGLIYTTGGFATGAHEPLRDARRAFDKMPLVTDQLNPIAQDASALIGQTNEAILRGIDGAIRGGTGVKTAGLNDELERIRQQNQSAILLAANLAQLERDKSRADDLSAAQAALQAARDELDVQLGIAEENAMAAREKLPEAAPDKHNLPALGSALTRGTFNVPDFAQFFAGGPLTLAQKQLDEAKRGTNRLGDIWDVLKKINDGLDNNGPRFA